jgi:membrane protease YdiL (CAAX protease family)
VADGQRRAREIAEAIAFFLALLAYLWLLAIPFPWAGVLVLLAVAVSWRRRSLTPQSLGLGWEEFRASGRRWGGVWIFSVALFLILGYRSLFSFAALTHGAVYFTWAAAQQVVYQSMTYLPLRDNLKSRWLAAGLAGVAFSIMHVPNPVLVPATLVWGVASSLLFERSRTVWGLALLQMMLSSTLFWITPPELNRDFRIGPYYYAAPARTFAPPVLQQLQFFSARDDLPDVERAARPAMPAVPPAGLPAWRARLRAPQFWLRLCYYVGQTIAVCGLP